MIPSLGPTPPILSTGMCTKRDFSATILTNCRIVVLGFFLLDHFIRGWPVFERDFSPDDPLVQHPYTSQQ